MEKRIFLLCDDKSEQLFVGRIVRTANQVTPELWELNVGDYLHGAAPSLGFLRES